MKIDALPTASRIRRSGDEYYLLNTHSYIRLMKYPSDNPSMRLCSDFSITLDFPILNQFFWLIVVKTRLDYTSTDISPIICSSGSKRSIVDISAFKVLI